MIRLATLLLVLATSPAYGQLNYEGNPFTENTEYIAEESNLSERSSRQNNAGQIDLASHDVSSSHPQKLYPVVETEMDKRQFQQATTTDDLLSGKSQRQTPLSFQIPRANAGDTSSRQVQELSDHHPNTAINTAEVALNSFLNSKTPEESRMSLDHYLRSQQSPGEDRSHSLNAIGDQNEQSFVQFDPAQPVAQRITQQLLLPRQQQQLQQQQQQQVQLMSQVNQGHLVSPASQQQQQRQQQQQQQQQQVQLMSQVNQGRLVSPASQQQQPFLPATQTYGYNGQPVVVQPMIRAGPSQGVVVGPGMLHPVPLVTPGFHARNDGIMSAMWRDRMRRIRGKPYAFAQPKLAPGLYKGPVTVPIKHNMPVEVIYTKPPGHHPGGPPAIISNPPIPYEDASAWFPDSNYPPPPRQKDIYYSQLYAQSYDPHYYNYIGATGKIRPYLYGKLGKKRQEEQDGGIWSELYRGFKTHGLKNIMTPTFLLGMTLPVVTLMLSALVQKRSSARSDEARHLDTENDAMREYLERLQRAMECYASGSYTRDTKLDGC